MTEKEKIASLQEEIKALKAQLEALAGASDSIELQAKYDALQTKYDELQPKFEELLVKYNELLKQSNTASKIPTGSFKVGDTEYTFKQGHLSVNISGIVYKTEELMADAEKNAALLQKLVSIGYRGLKIVE